MSKNRFRILIVLHIAFSLAATAIAAIAAIPGMYSSSLAMAYNNEPTTWLTTNASLTYAIMLPLIFASYIGLLGLYMFKHWGRTISVYTTAAFIVLMVSAGPGVESGLESALLKVSTILLGAILALAYYSSISNQFASSSPNGL